MKGKDDDDEEYYEDTREDSRDNRISLEIAKMIGSCMTGIRKEAFGIACLYLIIPANRQL